MRFSVWLFIEHPTYWQPSKGNPTVPHHRFPLYAYHITILIIKSMSRWLISLLWAIFYSLPSSGPFPKPFLHRNNFWKLIFIKGDSRQFDCFELKFVGSAHGHSPLYFLVRCKNRPLPSNRHKQWENSARPYF